MIADSDRLAHWTPAFFACALVNLGLGLALPALGLAWPARAAAASVSLASVHLLTVGWLTLLMFGALFQFVPAIAGRSLKRQFPAALTPIGTEAGLGLMVAGFAILGRDGAVLLPAGGTLVIASLALGAASLLPALAAKRPVPLSTRFVMAGLGFLLLTVLLGLTLAVAFTVPAAGATLGVLLPDGIGYHVLAGLCGWFTLTAIGVSYELLPMFMLAPHDRGALGAAVLWLGTGGFLTAFAAGIARLLWAGAWLAAAEQAGRAAGGLAIALYLLDVTRLYRARKRRQVELHNRAGLGAFAALGLALALAAAAMVTGRLTTAVPALVLLVLLGWLTGLGLTQLYKIVAFLAWLTRYGGQLGRGPVPLRVPCSRAPTSCAWPSPASCSQCCYSGANTCAPGAPPTPFRPPADPPHRRPPMSEAPPLMLDVRPELRAGGEPFGRIMQAVAGLAPGQGLRLLATFEPVPLYAVLSRKGLRPRRRAPRRGRLGNPVHPERRSGRRDTGVRRCRFGRRDGGALAHAARAPRQPRPDAARADGADPAHTRNPAPGRGARSMERPRAAAPLSRVGGMRGRHPHEARGRRRAAPDPPKHPP